MAIDWRDQVRRDRLRFYMVEPNNLERVLGELDGVDLSGSSITAGYYTDTRVSAKLKIVGDDSIRTTTDKWIRSSFIRIVHEVEGENYSNELGTFLVTNDGATREGATWAYELELQSMLYAISTDLFVEPWVRARGSSAMDCARRILQVTGRPYIERGAYDSRLKSALVLESGKSYLQHLYTCMTAANNRVDVDGHGRVTLSPYVSPDAKSPLFTIGMDETRGMIEEGSLKRTTDYLKMVDTVAVSYKYNDDSSGESVEREINAYVKVPDSSPISHAKRGYSSTEFHSLNEMNPPTAARARELAKQYLANNRESVEWQLNCAYMPIWEGDVIVLNVPDGVDVYAGARKCLVKNVDIDLATMQMSLTLRETASGEEESEDG